jgi:hypothetical protein
VNALLDSSSADADSAAELKALFASLAKRVESAQTLALTSAPIVSRDEIIAAAVAELEKREVLVSGTQSRLVRKTPTPIATDAAPDKDHYRCCFTIAPYDARGRPLTTDIPPEALLKRLSVLDTDTMQPIELQLTKDGVFKTPPFSPGPHLLTVCLDDCTLRGSPVAVNVRPIWSAKHSTGLLSDDRQTISARSQQAVGLSDFDAICSSHAIAVTVSVSMLPGAALQMGLAYPHPQAGWKLPQMLGVSSAGLKTTPSGAWVPAPVTMTNKTRITIVSTPDYGSTRSGLVCVRTPGLRPYSVRFELPRGAVRLACTTVNARVTFDSAELV